MGNRSAKLIQADVARTIRAVKQAGGEAIEIRPDGTMIVHMREIPLAGRSPKPIEPRKDIML